ncbi:hypothetical protein CaLGV100 [Clostera anastomosis granulovirus A]|uniref:Pif-6 n=1 Tax=Clostera anastomosis granulovirus A TaxID=1986289 RepID=U5KBN0_9BBAC|nr:hypothetical protein CaLGV100 [Clostera anastomosis granulovirus Henan]AGQ20358.1 hypothetical protein CaLGV100 [Clostera anastomosis granulovirus Henan]
MSTSRMGVSDGLLDILQKYDWQIVDNQLLEIVPHERENAWKDLLILTLSLTPRKFRKELRSGLLAHFDYKQPIFYNLNRHELGLANDSVLRALNPPNEPIFASSLIPPVRVVSSFIFIMLSLLLVEGMTHL